MRRALTQSGKKYIAVTSNTKLTFHGVIVKCSDCQKTIFDLIERSQQDKSMSVAFLFYCFGLVEGTPPVFLFVCHTGFSVMRHGSRQRLSLGQQVLCSRELIRLQLASRYSACMCTPVPVWDGGGKALMDQNIDTRILFKCIHGLTLSLRRKEKKLVLQQKFKMMDQNIDTRIFKCMLF